MVTNIEVEIYHSLWNCPRPRRFPVEVYAGGEYIMVSKSKWEDILARVAEEQYMKEADNNEC